MSVIIIRKTPPTKATSAQALTNRVTGGRHRHETVTADLDACPLNSLHGPGIEYDLVAVDQHRRAALPRERDRLLLGESPRDCIERQTLMHERQLDAPAVRAEGAFQVGSGEIVKLHPM
jgi:hypothetical protein